MYRMMLRFSLLRLEIVLTPTDFIPDRLIDSDKRCNRERERKRKRERVWERQRERERLAHICVGGIIFINPRNSRDRFCILSERRFSHCRSAIRYTITKYDCKRYYRYKLEELK